MIRFIHDIKKCNTADFEIITAINLNQRSALVSGSELAKLIRASRCDHNILQQKQE